VRAASGSRSSGTTTPCRLNAGATDVPVRPAPRAIAVFIPMPLRLGGVRDQPVGAAARTRHMSQMTELCQQPPGPCADDAADPQPAGRPGRARRCLHPPDPSPRWTVHRRPRHRVRIRGRRGQAQPNAPSRDEPVHRAIRTLRPRRAHRPDADLQRAARGRHPARRRDPPTPAARRHHQPVSEHCLIAPVSPRSKAVTDFGIVQACRGTAPHSPQKSAAQPPQRSTAPRSAQEAIL
jgi:hypothetical protein